MTHYIESLISLGFLAAMMWGMMRFMLRDIHKDLVDLKEGQMRLENRMDKSETRIDHLYQICIDLLKDRK